MEEATVSTTKTTVEEFAAIAGSADERLELIDGGIVRMPPAKWSHYKIQMRLLEMLRGHLASLGIVGMEMPYLTARGNVRVVDVGFMSKARMEAQESFTYPQQAPELVIEVASDESYDELSLRCRDAFATGSIEFWIVAPVGRTVTVFRKDGLWAVYGSEDRVPVPFTDSATIGVAEILP